MGRSSYVSAVTVRIAVAFIAVSGHAIFIDLTALTFVPMIFIIKLNGAVNVLMSSYITAVAVDIRSIVINVLGNTVFVDLIANRALHPVCSFVML